MKLLKCSHLSQQFGELRAVDDLSFEVEEGQIFGIAGPNGAGKTTLFNVISGIYSGTGGEVLFNNESILGLRPYKVCRKGVARTLQIPQLFTTLSVLNNIRIGACFGSEHAKNVDKEIAQIIEFLKLEGKESIIASNLNLYDKKLTMLAAALATKPRLLLLDEPIGGLSPTEVQAYVKLINKINLEQKITIIVIEHLMKVLTSISKSLMIMENGKLVKVGPPMEVIKDKKVIEIYLGRGKHA